MLYVRLFCALLAFVVLCNAQFVPKIGGGAPQVADAPHACIVAVRREDHEEGRAGLAGGSIVSRNRVLTAAHALRNAVQVFARFYVGNPRPDNARLRQVEAIFWQPDQRFNPLTLDYDVAIIQFAANVFPQGNVIPVSNVAVPPPSTAGTVVSFGFTHLVQSVSVVPLAAGHTTVQLQTCTNMIVGESHFCATAAEPTEDGEQLFICQGDNGSGLYTGDGEARRLIGLVSRLSPNVCTITGLATGFTNLGDAHIQRFLASQDVTPVAPSAAVPPPGGDEVAPPGGDEVAPPGGDDVDYVSE